MKRFRAKKAMMREKREERREKREESREQREAFQGDVLRCYGTVD